MHYIYGLIILDGKERKHICECSKRTQNRRRSTGPYSFAFQRYVDPFVDQTKQLVLHWQKYICSPKHLHKRPLWSRMPGAGESHSHCWKTGRQTSQIQGVSTWCLMMSHVVPSHPFTSRPPQKRKLRDWQPGGWCMPWGPANGKGMRPPCAHSQGLSERIGSLIFH